ncbi:MAG: hypothetical protein GY835_15055 [bacterium]|nr:hypothetical protein [bacterium]
MKKLIAPIIGLVLLASVADPSLAFQEYPSIEIMPYAGYLLYDSDMDTYSSNLTYGMRIDLRTMALVGFQFNYALSASSADFPNSHFGKDDYVERIQLNLTRDLLLTRGVFISGYGGIGSFNRRTAQYYENDFSIQAGLSARRNIRDFLYLRADAGWTGAFLHDTDPNAMFGDGSTLTHHFEAALSFSFLFDN